MRREIKVENLRIRKVSDDLVLYEKGYKFYLFRLELRKKSYRVGGLELTKDKHKHIQKLLIDID